MAANWTTISSLATAGGTLILAISTFALVRSANRAARTAERAFEVGLRPVLFASRLDDVAQKIRWGDDHWGQPSGGQGHHGGSDENHAELATCIHEHGHVVVDLLYGHHEGGQRTVNRFVASQREGERGPWLCYVTRHWNLDRSDPR